MYLCSGSRLWEVTRIQITFLWFPNRMIHRGTTSWSEHNGMFWTLQVSRSQVSRSELTRLNCLNWHHFTIHPDQQVYRYTMTGTRAQSIKLMSLSGMIMMLPAQEVQAGNSHQWVLVQQVSTAPNGVAIRKFLCPMGLCITIVTAGRVCKLGGPYIYSAQRAWKAWHDQPATAMSSE